MKKLFFWISLMVAIILPLYGCGGGGGGAPGSSGTTDTGIRINSVQVTGGDPSEEVWDVDAAIHMCEGDPEDGLYRVAVTVDINSIPLNNNSLFDPYPATVEQCNITYKKANQDPAAPIIESWTIYPNCPLTSGLSSCNLHMIDIERKNRWWADMRGGVNIPAEYPTHYVAVYRCMYRNVFGEKGYFEVEQDFWMADFDNC